MYTRIYQLLIFMGAGLGLSTFAFAGEIYSGDYCRKVQVFSDQELNVKLSTIGRLGTFDARLAQARTNLYDYLRTEFTLAEKAYMTMFGQPVRGKERLEELKTRRRKMEFFGYRLDQIRIVVNTLQYHSMSKAPSPGGTRIKLCERALNGVLNADKSADLSCATRFALSTLAKICRNPNFGNMNYIRENYLLERDADLDLEREFLEESTTTNSGISGGN